MLTRRMLLAALLAVACTLSFGTTRALAQDTGTITGVVTDESGAPQSGVKVFLTAPAAVEGGAVGPRGGASPQFTTGLGDVVALQAKGVRKVAETVTDSSGRFTFANVKTGAYVLMVGKMAGGARFPARVEAGKTFNVNAAVKASQLK